MIEQLLDPPQHELHIDDPNIVFSLELFLSLNTSSQKAYHDARRAAMKRHPEDAVLLWEQVEHKLVELTGVTTVMTDCCIKMCIAFTGLWEKLESCLKCCTSRWDPAKLEATRGCS
jgi:hypothetical protein